MKEVNQQPMETAGARNLQHADTGVSGPRPPIILGAGEATVATVETSSREPELTTADIAGRKKYEAVTKAASPTGSAAESQGLLFAADETADFRSRWDSVQAGFVDEPRRAVEQADNLVAAAIKRLAEVFADERQRLEEQWTREESVSTEDLRLSLRRYRSFFGRLLSI